MKYYETPEMEILLLKTEDVITGSLIPGEGVGDGNEDGTGTDLGNGDF